MSWHLKNIVISGLEATCATFVTLPPDATPHTRGVRYFYLNEAAESLRGAMDLIRVGQKRRKRIVVRPSRFRIGLHELYTYHFPTRWSAACVANRELIKEAQRRAHALERDHSMEALEWRIRFFIHYFNVFKAHRQPEPGLKRYSRFYQYTYVSIYRQLKAAQQTDQHETDGAALSLPPVAEEVTFEPVPFRRLHSFARRRQAFSRVFLGAMTPLIE